MANPLIRKLEQVTQLSAEDKRVLQQIAAERVRVLGPREDIVHEGDKPAQINVILTGWACRYKQLEDGRRSIMAFLLPGDLFDQNIVILSEMDHSVRTITPVTVAEMPQRVFEDLTLHHQLGAFLQHAARVGGQLLGQCGQRPVLSRIVRSSAGAVRKLSGDQDIIILFRGLVGVMGDSHADLLGFGRLAPAQPSRVPLYDRRAAGISAVGQRLSAWFPSQCFCSWSRCR